MGYGGLVDLQNHRRSRQPTHSISPCRDQDLTLIILVAENVVCACLASRDGCADRVCARARECRRQRDEAKKKGSNDLHFEDDDWRVLVGLQLDSFGW